MPLGFKYPKVTYLMTGRVYVGTPPDPPDQPPPDSNPTVTLTAPADAATIDTGATDFLATATDDTGVARVEFYVDDVLVGQESQAPYGWGDVSEPTVPQYDVTALSDGSHTFSVIAVDVAGNRSAPDSATVTIDNTGDPPPPAPTDSEAFGYYPDVPALAAAGFTVVENGNFSTLSGTAVNRVYVDCTGGFWMGTGGGGHDIVCIRGNHYGSMCGNNGSHYNVSHYGCVFGGVTSGGGVTRDGCQIKPTNTTIPKPHHWLFQGCAFIDILGGDTQHHTDGLQVGAVDDVTVRHCFFRNITIECILVNNWNGTPTNVLVDQCAFSDLLNHSGPPVHFSAGTGHAATNCYRTGGSVATNSETGTQPIASWPHGTPTGANKFGIGY